MKYLVSRERNLADIVALLRASFAISSITLKNLEGKCKRNSVQRKDFLEYDIKLDAVKICQRTPHSDHPMHKSLNQMKLKQTFACMEKVETMLVLK